MPHRASKTPLNGVMRTVEVAHSPRGSSIGIVIRFVCSDCGKKFSVWLGEKVPVCPCWTREDPRLAKVQGVDIRDLAKKADRPFEVSEPAPTSAERCPRARSDKPCLISDGDTAYDSNGLCIGCGLTWREVRSSDKSRGAQGCLSD